MKAKSSKTVIFSYQQLSNVGCEIIIRGTIAFLKRAFPGHDLRFVLASYDQDRDRRILGDLSDIEIVPMLPWKRYVRGALVKLKLERYFWTPRFATRHLRKADLFVSVGGDIYTMSGNALPKDWLGYEKFATHHGIPSIMFGANMEKFEVLTPSDRARLIAHLKRFRLIAVRDLKTVGYLAQHGVTDNIAFFPDPIFMLRPSPVFSGGSVRVIGLNISPLILRDYGEGIFEHFAQLVTDLVEKGYDVRLLPHVYASDRNPSLDDRTTLRRLHNVLAENVRKKVKLYEQSVSFEDIARAIDEVDLFVGARMHSCLNALTLGKPTYFLSYSSKARTMVDWLVKGAFSPVANRIGFGAADKISVDDVLGLIAAHEEAAQDGEVRIDVSEILNTSPVWDTIAASGLAEGEQSL